MMTGRSISEVQATISHSEFQMWLRYRAKWGPMNPIRLYDAGPAMICSIIKNALGGKTKAADFMPYYENAAAHEKPDAAPSLEDFVKSFGGVKIGRR